MEAEDPLTLSLSPPAGRGDDAKAVVDSLSPWGEVWGEGELKALAILSQ